MRVEVAMVARDRVDDDDVGRMIYHEVEDWDAETSSEVYHDALGTYGRCTGKVYVGEGTPCGWVFVKRITDVRRPYIQEAWIMPVIEKKVQEKGQG